MMRICHRIKPIKFVVRSLSTSSRFDFLFSQTEVWPPTCTFDPKCLYDYLKEVESHWKPILSQVNESRKHDPKSGTTYILSMFPYPSGSLHLGHVKIYTSSDILSRYHELNGRKVVHPMGWDSFGLPAENAALQRDINPHDWTYSNIESMRHQLESLGLKVEWREATSDASFYKWTQWLIIQLFKHNLLYKSFGVVNWDPVDKTVLADDQVDPDGKSWRSGAQVEKRFLKQWFIKTTAFHSVLYEGMGVRKGLDGVHFDQVLQMQRTWMGQPKGYVFYLDMGDGNVLPIFTSTPEKFLSDDVVIAISSDHWMASRLLDEDKICVKNPFTQKELRIVIAPEKNDVPKGFKATLFSSSHENQDIRQNLLKSIDPKLGGYFSSDTYSDWLISRQRYWGTPIPIVTCSTCGTISLNDSDLPLKLPPVNDFSKLKSTTSASTSSEVRSKIQDLAPQDWLTTTCPKCNKDGAIRETDTCDTFVDSSWYYLRFGTPARDDRPFDEDFVSRNAVSVYLGGPEHATGHLLTSRFVFHFLRKYGYITSSHTEPYEKLLLQGIVSGKSFKHNGVYMTEAEAQRLVDEKIASKKDIIVNYEKMSKSKGNGVNPNELIEAYGTDATRLCVLGSASSQSNRIWRGSEAEFQEITKFLRKLLLTVDQFIYLRQLKSEDPRAPVVRRFSAKDAKDQSMVDEEIKRLHDLRNRTICDVYVVFEKNYKLGRGSKKLMELLENMRTHNMIRGIGFSYEFEKCLGDLLIMIHPFMPHLTQELWTGFAAYADRSSFHGVRYDLDERVDEQNFPVMDDDYKIPIDIRVDKENFGGIIVDRDVINRCDENEIRKIVKQQFTDKRSELGLRDEDIQKVLLIPGFRASVCFVTPDHRFGKKKKKKNQKSEDSDDEDVEKIHV